LRNKNKWKKEEIEERKKVKGFQKGPIIPMKYSHIGNNQSRQRRAGQ